MAGVKEGKGNGNKGGGQQRGRGWQDKCNGKKGGGQAVEMVRKRAMATVMRVAGNKEGDGDCDGNNVGNGDSNKDGPP